ncbi:MAG: hypothetical protein WCK28_01585 [Burkholderiales bacterium]
MFGLLPSHQPDDARLQFGQDRPEPHRARFEHGRRRALPALGPDALHVVREGEGVPERPPVGTDRVGHPAVHRVDDVPTQPGGDVAIVEEQIPFVGAVPGLADDEDPEVVVARPFPDARNGKLREIVDGDASLQAKQIVREKGASFETLEPDDLESPEGPFRNVFEGIQDAGEMRLRIPTARARAVSRAALNARRSPPAAALTAAIRGASE